MTPDGVPLLADRYSMHRRIAIGDSAEVWRATDVMLSRTVAIKLLRPELAADPEAVARFRDKARHAGSVPGGGIIRIYDYNETCPSCPPFMAMEYIDGLSLGEILSGGPLAPDQTLDMVAQIARTLQDTHRAGLTHPDIKPENVLISRNGLVKLTDFGSSRLAGTASMTGTGSELDDASYLAPERVSGGQGSPASDLYTVGILAYQCLTGALPFTGTPVEVALAHRTSPVPPLPASISPEIAALVGELTAKDPVARPDSAGQVARKAAAIRDRMVTVRPPPPQDTQPFPAPDQANLAPVASLAPTYPRYARQRQVVLPTLAVTAIVLALVLGHVIDPVRPAAKTPASVTLVDVSSTALRGRLVTAVQAQLRKLGLAVSVRWAISSAVPPGRVLSVSPVGKVPAGTLITVTGARLRPQTQQQFVLPSAAASLAASQAARPRPSKRARHPASATAAASSPAASGSPSPAPTTPSPSPSPAPSATSAPSSSPSPAPT
ncbi:MAG: protein kinase [Streptosporangiaceae bacterium]|jgi:serine/threonine protein kinase